MISVQFMKITKIFDHENLELYGISTIMVRVNIDKLIWRKILMNAV